MRVMRSAAPKRSEERRVGKECRSNWGPRNEEEETAVVVAMPIDADVFAGGVYDCIDGELHEVEGAVGWGVAHGVAESDGARVVSNGSGVKAFDGAGICFFKQKTAYELAT